MRRTLCALAAVAGLGAGLGGGATASAEIINGIEFPLGDLSFADVVRLYEPGPGVESPHNDPANVLGLPDSDGSSNFTSLGPNGTLIIEFTDNRLIDQDEVENGADLYIFEVGGQVESFHVAISTDGTNYIEIGTVSGQPTAIDIGPFVEPDQEFRFVRLIDTGNNASGSPFAGADIDAIGAIGAVIPEPAGLSLLAGGALFLRRRR